jgi:SWIM/SEC-C metal-binding protein
MLGGLLRYLSRPAVVRVQTMQKAQKIMKICERHGWKIIVGIESDKPEEISDFEKLQVRLGGVRHKTGRNEPCYCGSGDKFKHCCDF